MEIERSNLAHEAALSSPHSQVGHVGAAPAARDGRAAAGATARCGVDAASGAVGRLHRSFGRWGDAAYAFEELVAEIGAATLCRHAGLPGLAMQTAYIEHWLTHLKADPQLLWHVMRLAEEAVAYLLAALDDVA